MIHTIPPVYPYTHHHVIEVSATTESFRLRDRLPGFNPHNRFATGLFWGGHDGPGAELNFRQMFGDVLIEPQLAFVLDAKREARDVDCKYLARDHGARPLLLAQVLAVCGEALLDPALNAIFANKLNLFFVQDPSGILRAVTVLSTRNYCILGVGEANVGSHHLENYLLTLA